MSGPQKRSILIVDANLDHRVAVRRMLASETRSYTFTEAPTGEQGLRLVRTESPDCVLLDFHLPDMDGGHFLESLQWSAADGLPVPVIVLTGDQSDEIGSAALKRGAQDYLLKAALNGSVLARAIENAIEKLKIQKELVQSRLAVELRNRKLEVLRDQLQDKVVELAQATRTKDQFMAVMSHEMRTPLNAIIGYADLLQMEIDGELNEGQREQVDRIRVGGRHLLDLINDILDLARADADQLQLDLRPVDVSAVIEEVTALLESQAADKGIHLVREPCGPSVPAARADLHRLRQILMNLIGNAVKFTETGEIRVRCRTADADFIQVDVVDTGIGIDPDVLPMIFSDFFQVSGDLTREKGGTGLGLAISRRLAKLMGGDIEVVSTPSEGSTFTLVLPSAAPGSELRQDDVDQHAERMQIHDATAAHRGRPYPISVVAFGEDEASLKELERQVHPGVRLSWTTKAEEVAELATREGAALVVVDIATAKGEGWRAAQALQDAPDLAQTAILLLPSIPPIPEEESDVAGLDLGWLALVPKPFTAAQLTHAVSTAARGHEEEEDGERKVDYEVLVVDDDPDSRRVAAKFLTESRLRVREAPDGESALVEMHRKAPDVVVLDLMMPVLDGFGVLATMRADPALANLPVVVLTAKSLTEAERHFLARTAVRVLQKGEHRLADVAALVLRAAGRAQVGKPSEAATGTTVVGGDLETEFT